MAGEYTEASIEIAYQHEHPQPTAKACTFETPEGSERITARLHSGGADDRDCDRRHLEWGCPAKLFSDA